MSSVTLPRPAERIAIFSLVIVFLCGGVAGAMAMSFWFHPILHGPHQQAQSGMTMSIDEWKRQLDLSDDQARQLMSVLDDFSHYYDNLLADGNTRILNLLNPVQKLKFEKMMRERKQAR